MTSRPRNDGHHRERGFTLVELLLVLALVVMLAAMAAPSLSGTLARVRLDSAAEQLRTVWADARLDAIRAGEPVAFQCELGTNRYTVSTLAELTAGATTTGEPTEAEQLADDEHSDLGDVQFVELTVGDPAAQPQAPAEAIGSACLVFRADGAADDAFAVIQDARGVQRRISLRGLTCAATIDDAPPEEP